MKNGESGCGCGGGRKIEVAHDAWADLPRPDASAVPRANVSDTRKASAGYEQFANGNKSRPPSALVGRCTYLAKAGVPMPGTC
jgi:hypothetical protein